MTDHVAIELPTSHIAKSPGSKDDLKAHGSVGDLKAVGMTHVESGTGRGLRITFKDLDYVVKNQANKKEDLHLLKKVSGYMQPAEMTALMGPSGSGKTTLLDVLAGRKTMGRKEGEIKFAGAEPSTGFLRRYTGYVEQFDTLLPTLTVYEMLLYTAELKRPLQVRLATPGHKLRARVQRTGMCNIPQSPTCEVT